MNVDRIHRNRGIDSPDPAMATGTNSDEHVDRYRFHHLWRLTFKHEPVKWSPSLVALFPEFSQPPTKRKQCE